MNDHGQQARQFTLDEAAARNLIADLGIPDDHRLIASGAEMRSTFRALDAEYPYCHLWLNDTAVSDVIRHCHANGGSHLSAARHQPADAGIGGPQRDTADGHTWVPGGDLVHCNDVTSNYHGLFGLEEYHGPDRLLRVIREAVRAGNTTVSQLSDFIYPDDPASEAAQQPAKPSPPSVKGSGTGRPGQEMPAPR